MSLEVFATNSEQMEFINGAADQAAAFMVAQGVAKEESEGVGKETARHALTLVLGILVENGALEKRDLTPRLLDDLEVIVDCKLHPDHVQDYDVFFDAANPGVLYD